MRKLQKGMWVKTNNGRVGLLFQNTITNNLEFHLVEDDGSTTLIVPIVGLPEEAGYVQAGISDIPKSRRPTPDVAQKLEYAK